VDAADARLASLVHPPDWANPTPPRQRYHLVVVGAGTAGLVTAAIAAALGARVALVERHLMGGDCLNVGCVPSKAVIRAARAWAAAREAGRFGGPAVPGDAEGDFGAVMTRLRALRAALAPVDSAARFRELGVDVYLGTGRFTGPDALAVTGADGRAAALRFRRAVVATGARAAVPPVPGLAESGFFTNETIFDLTARPEHLVVLGAGPIGCELAQSFARFGSRVTVLDRNARALPFDDPDAGALVRSALERDGVRFALGVTATRVERRGDAVTVAYRAGDAGPEEHVTGDALLVAAGRAPTVANLGLDAAGVKHDARAGVAVDDRLRTSNPRVYAVGDVASRYKFTHAADALARLVVPNALFGGRGKASALVVPWATYTSPEVAHVGLTAADAAERGDAVQAVTVPLAEVDRARLDDADGAPEGFLRVYVRRGSDEILGATLVGEHAGDLISQVTQAMTNGLGLGALGKTIYPYPTTAEALRKAADAHRRAKLTPTAKRALAAVLRVLR
jgi:pyruvate/2-oxoglutarate dehydrogenase complex dihydrolipoamide dehydrogenase (E3) component